MDISNPRAFIVGAMDSSIALAIFEDSSMLNSFSRLLLTDLQSVKYDTPDSLLSTIRFNSFFLFFNSFAMAAKLLAFNIITK